MIIGTGTDIVSVSRMGALHARGPAVLARWFTPAELDYCGSKTHPERHLAARMAAKEAAFKSLRLSGDRAVPWAEIEVGHDAAGCPVAQLWGGLLAEVTDRYGAVQLHVSLSHTDEHATATAIAVAGGPPA